MARIGRPRKSDDGDLRETRGVSLPGKTWQRVDRAAQEDGKTRSGVVEEAVTEHLDRRDGERGKR